jgi:hypothetical protein
MRRKELVEPLANIIRFDRNAAWKSLGHFPDDTTSPPATVGRLVKIDGFLALAKGIPPPE